MYFLFYLLSLQPQHLTTQAVQSLTVKSPATQQELYIPKSLDIIYKELRLPAYPAIRIAGTSLSGYVRLNRIKQ